MHQDARRVQTRRLDHGLCTLDAREQRRMDIDGSGGRRLRMEVERNV